MSTQSSSTALHPHTSSTATRPIDDQSPRAGSVQALKRVASKTQEREGDDTDLESDDPDYTPLRRENAFSNVQEFEAALRKREELEREEAEEYESWITSLLRARRAQAHRGNDRSMVKHRGDAGSGEHEGGRQ
ncbi:hypothetical protein BC629DRAFT_1446663 [Irpex lacteus]|nr:hypothetical protein BC629DRAFT_1446663 [Irpex lacteus]